MIKENVQRLLKELPEGVQLVAAAKARTAQEIEEAIAAGIKIIGENYVQEAERVFRAVGRKVKRHFIGHLQKNKVNKAVKIFDMIETLDSAPLADALDKACARENKIMPVLVEVNSGREKQKFGVLPEQIQPLIEELSRKQHIKVVGLMTMGPQFGDPEQARPYFKETKKIFERIKGLSLPNVEMQYLSMGMSNSYQVAVAEGANLVRIGSKIFGARESAD
ncbi:MAG: YggS family pyridoxal phosphate-dependent enzyme [Candidatus Omnitrophica bacterium]|nr:YggS family pyridoxal phosphate-dependent enzyme [Candidatus Omnitrophota bacterium]